MAKKEKSEKKNPLIIKLIAGILIFIIVVSSILVGILGIIVEIIIEVVKTIVEAVLNFFNFEWWRDFTNQMPIFGYTPPDEDTFIYEISEEVVQTIKNSIENGITVEENNAQSLVGGELNTKAMGLSDFLIKKMLLGYFGTTTTEKAVTMIQLNDEDIEEILKNTEYSNMDDFLADDNNVIKREAPEWSILCRLNYVTETVFYFKDIDRKSRN